MKRVGFCLNQNEDYQTQTNQYNRLKKIFKQICESNGWGLSDKYPVLDQNKIYILERCCAGVDYEIKSISEKYAEENNIQVNSMKLFIRENIFDLGDIVSDNFSKYFGKIIKMELNGFKIIYHVKNSDMVAKFNSDTLSKVGL